MTYNPFISKISGCRRNRNSQDIDLVGKRIKEAQDDTAHIIIYTSGTTTGESKGVVLTHAN